jgi:hypothetical protein
MHDLSEPEPARPPAQAATSALFQSRRAGVQEAAE